MVFVKLGHGTQDSLADSLVPYVGYEGLGLA